MFPAIRPWPMTIGHVFAILRRSASALAICVATRDFRDAILSTQPIVGVLLLTRVTCLCSKVWASPSMHSYRSRMPAISKPKLLFFSADSQTFLKRYLSQGAIVVRTWSVGVQIILQQWLRLLHDLMHPGFRCSRVRLPLKLCNEWGCWQSFAALLGCWILPCWVLNFGGDLLPVGICAWPSCTGLWVPSPLVARWMHFWSSQLLIQTQQKVFPSFCSPYPLMDYSPGRSYLPR